MSTNTTNFNLVKPELTDPADITAINTNWDKIDEQLSEINGRIVQASSSDGVNYTATNSNIKTLYPGLTITLIPLRTSASLTPTLNLNDFGSKNIKLPLSSNSTATTQPTSTSWLALSVPIDLQYDGTQWKAINLVRPSASSLYGSVPIANGGTGADTAEEALANMGGISRKLLWENSNVDSDFSAQQIALSDFNSYSGFEILYQYGKFCGGVKSTGFLTANKNFQLDGFLADNAGADPEWAIRTGQFMNKNIVFYDAIRYTISGGEETQNARMIPYRIYGIKGVL